jgi:hypothetical protein
MLTSWNLPSTKLELSFEKANNLLTILSRAVCVTIDGVWIVTTNNYNTIAISTLYSSLEHTVYCSQSISRRFLVTAPTKAISLPPCSSHRTDWVAPIVFKITPMHVRHRKHSSSNVAFVSVAAGTCLPRRCLETGLVYPPVSRSLPSIGPTRYNILRECSIIIRTVVINDFGVSTHAKLYFHYPENHLFSRTIRFWTGIFFFLGGGGEFHLLFQTGFRYNILLYLDAKSNMSLLRGISLLVLTSISFNAFTKVAYVHLVISWYSSTSIFIILNIGMRYLKISVLKFSCHMWQKAGRNLFPLCDNCWFTYFLSKSRGIYLVQVGNSRNSSPYGRCELAINTAY